MSHYLRIAVIVSCLGVPAESAEAQLAQCTSDLELLRVAAADAHERSSGLQTVQNGLVSRRDEFIRCQEEVDRISRDIERTSVGRVPQVLDCSSLRLSAQSAETQYAAAVDSAREGLIGLASAVQAVERSCQVPLAAFTPALGSAETRSPACDSFLASRPGAPLAALRVLCESELSPEECTACLGSRE